MTKLSTEELDQIATIMQLVRNYGLDCTDWQTAEAAVDGFTEIEERIKELVQKAKNES